jgi:hypothetical protein
MVQCATALLCVSESAHLLVGEDREVKRAAGISGDFESGRFAQYGLSPGL